MTFLKLISLCSLFWVPFCFSEFCSKKGRVGSEFWGQTSQFYQFAQLRTIGCCNFPLHTYSYDDIYIYVPSYHCSLVMKDDSCILSESSIITIRWYFSRYSSYDYTIKLWNSRHSSNSRLMNELCCCCCCCRCRALLLHLFLHIVTIVCLYCSGNACANMFCMRFQLLHVLFWNVLFCSFGASIQSAHASHAMITYHIVAVDNNSHQLANPYQQCTATILHRLNNNHTLLNVDHHMGSRSSFSSQDCILLCVDENCCSALVTIKLILVRATVVVVVVVVALVIVTGG